MSSKWDGIRKTSYCAFAGAGVGLCVGILGVLAGELAEMALQTTVTSWEMGTLAVPLACTVGGLLVGALASLRGTWNRGLLIGVVVAGLFCGWWLVDAWSFPLGVKVWSATVWLIAGPAAGGVAGWLGGGPPRRLGRKDRPALLTQSV
jgi:hypothetical protein